ncbi:MAG: 4-diphosphocytidyl-2-C-methyl-D-erythritol kinase [Candidatus Sulfotelmatobacter sp.]|nr:4-diphosphocytidyl-2-C-methyl-D-erythritol kinase [Candidatus Sulfotelmatobacter sp.]
MPVTTRSFAKINLGLRIEALRADGFHGLLTVYQTIGLHDLIRVSVGRGSGIEILCSDPRVPRDESNTCYRIVDKAMQGLKAKGRVTIEIGKRLPVQGGLGGASSNAVAAMLGLERALKKSLPPAERLRITSEVGSDLPLFLVGGTVLGLGRGEQVYPLEDFSAMACVVVTPEVGVSTPKAFAQWDRLCGSTTAKTAGREEGSELAGHRPARTGKSAHPRTGGEKLTVPVPSDRMIELGRGLSAWLSEMYSGAPFRRGRRENPLLELVRAGIKNDFERVVFPEYPELSEGKRALERAGAKYASLSGSGSALYGLFASKAAARAAVAKLRKQGLAAQPTVTLTRQQYWNRLVEA